MTRRCRGGGLHRALDEEVEGEDADAGGQEAAPEDGVAVEARPLLHHEQQPPNGRRKRCRHSCRTHTTVICGRIRGLQNKACSDAAAMPGPPDFYGNLALG